MFRCGIGLVWIVICLCLVELGAGQECVKVVGEAQCANACVPEGPGEPFSCDDWFTKQSCCLSNETEFLLNEILYVCVCQYNGLSGAGIGIVTACVLILVLCVAFCIYFFSRIARKNKLRDHEYNRLAIEATKKYLPR